MEPTSFNVGDQKKQANSDIYQLASMEPTSFNVGDLSLSSMS